MKNQSAELEYYHDFIQIIFIYYRKKLYFETFFIVTIHIEQVSKFFMNLKEALGRSYNYIISSGSGFLLFPFLLDFFQQ